MLFRKFPEAQTWLPRAVQANHRLPLLTDLIEKTAASATSLAISKTSNPKIVQRMLGHRSAAMTSDTYADLFDDDSDTVAIELDAARSERSESILSPKPVIEMKKTP